MKSYFIYDGGTEQGPFSIDELKTKKLKLDTPIWYEGLPQWTTVELVDDVKHLIATPPKFFEPAKSTSLDEFSVNESEQQYADALTQHPIKSKWKLMLIIGTVMMLLIAIFIYANQQQHKIEEVQRVLDAKTLEDDQKQRQLEDVQQALTKKNLEELNRQKKLDAINAHMFDCRNNWKKYLKIETGDYTVADFGGISGLDLRLRNDTDYKLDNVEIEVQYIRDGGDIWKSETVTFKNFPVHAEETKYAPDSKRGTSVKVKIKNVTASSFNFCYNSDFEELNASSIDPWKCK